jgi:hypothetical protein
MLFCANLGTDGIFTAILIEETSRLFLHLRIVFMEEWKVTVAFLIPQIASKRKINQLSTKP